MARALLRSLAVVAVLLAPAGTAAALDGDFGRPGSDSNLPDWLQSLLSGHHGGLNRSDAEVEMTNRLWRFVASPDAPPWMIKRADTLRPAGRAQSGDTSRYFGWLHTTSYQSSAVRYATVDNDIEADLGTIPGAFAAVCSVISVDHQRVVALAHLPAIEPAIAADLVARRGDNDRQIKAFVWSLRYRYDSYSYALDHLLVETPDPAARAVDAALQQLEDEVVVAEQQRFCDGDAISAEHRPASGPPLPSRFVHGVQRTDPKGAPIGS